MAKGSVREGMPFEPLSRLAQGNFSFERYAYGFVLRLPSSETHLLSKIPQRAIIGVTTGPDVMVNLDKDLLGQVADALSKAIPQEFPKIIAEEMKRASREEMQAGIMPPEPAILKSEFVQFRHSSEKQRGDALTESLCQALEQMGLKPTVLEDPRKFSFYIRVGKETASVRLASIGDDDFSRPGSIILFANFRLQWFKDAFKKVTGVSDDASLWQALVSERASVPWSESYPVQLSFGEFFRGKEEMRRISQIISSGQSAVGSAFLGFFWSEVESALPEGFGFLSAHAPGVYPKTAKALASMIANDDSYQQAVKAAQAKITEIERLVKDEQALKNRLTP